MSISYNDKMLRNITNRQQSSVNNVIASNIIRQQYNYNVGTLTAQDFCRILVISRNIHGVEQMGEPTDKMTHEGYRYTPEKLRISRDRHREMEKKRSLRKGKKCVPIIIFKHAHISLCHSSSSVRRSLLVLVRTFPAIPSNGIGLVTNNFCVCPYSVPILKRKRMNMDKRAILGGI